MADLVTTLFAKEISCNASSSVSFTRGLRGTLQSDGTYALSSIGDIGQIVANTPTPAAGGAFVGVALNASYKVPAVVAAGITASVGDSAWSAASGTFSNVQNTSGVLMGVWSQIAAAGGVGEIVISA